MKKLVIVGLFFISHFSIYSEADFKWNTTPLNALDNALLTIPSNNPLKLFALKKIKQQSFLEKQTDETINQLTDFFTLEGQIAKNVRNNTFADTYQAIDQFEKSINSFSQEAKSEILDFYK